VTDRCAHLETIRVDMPDGFGKNGAECAACVASTIPQPGQAQSVRGMLRSFRDTLTIGERS